MGIGVLIGLLGATAMASKASRQRATWIKAIAGGVALCIGGPALVMYVMPSEEALIEKYNPELKARALANREQRQQQSDDFLRNMVEQSKSNKHIWDVAKDQREKLREDSRIAQLEAEAAQARRREEIRQQALSGR